MIQDSATYWHNREAFSVAAREHHKQMVLTHTEQIAASIKNSVIYGGNGKEPAKSTADGSPSFIFSEQDTVPALYHAVQMYPGKKIAVLDFASYQHAGSKFLDGDLGQEESICFESTLYECQTGHPEYYQWNREHKNHALYTNRALYIPDVIFGWNGETACAVLCVSAPNRNAYTRYFGASADAYNRNALISRIEFIRDTAETEGVQVLIIGAFGCGDAKQDQDEVAAIFRDVFSKSVIETVICAVPPKNKKNQEAFRKIFGN